MKRCAAHHRLEISKYPLPECCQLLEWHISRPQERQGKNYLTTQEGPRILVDAKGFSEKKRSRRAEPSLIKPWDLFFQGGPYGRQKDAYGQKVCCENSGVPKEGFERASFPLLMRRAFAALRASHRKRKTSRLTGKPARGERRKWAANRSPREAQREKFRASPTKENARPASGAQCAACYFFWE